MAGKEDIVFKVSVDERGKSLSDLKKEFRDLQTEVSNATKGTDQYYQSLQKLANVKDEMEDLRKEITGLQGAGRFQAFGNVANTIAGGFQAATAAAALFGTEATEIQATLLKVQAAASLAEGIRSLEGMQQAFKVLATIIRSNPIFLLGTVLLGVVAGIKLLNDNLDETKVITQQIVQENENLAKSYEDVAAAYDRRISLARVSGADELNVIDLQIQKLREVERIEGQRAENFAALSLKYQNGSEEQVKYYNLALEAEQKNIEAVYKQTELLFQRDAVIDARNKKDAADREKRLADDKKAKEQILEPLEEIDLLKELGRVNEEEELRKIKLKQDYEAETTRINKELRRQEDEAIKKAEEDALKRKKIEQDVNDAKLQLASASIQSVQMLSDTYFQNQLIAVRGNSEKEREIRKKQFDLDKAFSIARATIDGYRSVTGALAQTAVLGPAAPILAAANAILAAATIAKIAATKFDGGAPQSSFALPSTGQTTPQVQTNTSANTPVRNDITFLDENGQNLSKVYVTEKDISKTQNRVNKLKARATY